MHHPGYLWTIRPEGDLWFWQARGRDDQTLVERGLAGSRAEAAACLVRAITRDVTADMQPERLTA